MLARHYLASRLIFELHDLFLQPLGTYANKIRFFYERFCLFAGDRCPAASRNGLQSAASLTLLFLISASLRRLSIKRAPGNGRPNTMSFIDIIAGLIATP